jgi:hypothetical protein
LRHGRSGAERQPLAVTFNGIVRDQTCKHDVARSSRAPPAALTATATVDASQSVATGLPTTRMSWRVRANEGAWSPAPRLQLKN